MYRSAIALTAFLAHNAHAGCPFTTDGTGIRGSSHRKLPAGHPGSSSDYYTPVDPTDRVRFKIPPSRRHLAVEHAYSNQRQGEGGIPEGGYAAVRDEIKKLLTDSQDDVWPGDFNGELGLDG